jgi:hypothetical protein
MIYNSTRDPDEPEIREYSKLPNIILLKIFAKCAVVDLAAIAQVCKKWNRISDHNALWRYLLKKKRISVPKSINYKKYYKQCVDREKSFQKFMQKRRSKLPLPVPKVRVHLLLHTKKDLTEDTIIQMWGF